MTEGRDRQMWVHTSCLAAIIVNASGNVKKGKTFTPADFDPYAAAEKREAELKNTEATWQMMKAMYKRD